MTDIAVCRASPLSELSEKAAMKMWRSPSTSESLRQGTPKDLKRRDTNLTTLTEDSSYSANNMSSAHRSPFATADDASDYGESFHSANQNMAHISFSGDLPKSTSYMDVQPRQ